MTVPQNRKNQLKKIDRPFDFVLFIVVLTLLAMGIVMVLSASSPSALAESGNSYTYVTRQATFAVIGIVLMLVISKWDYHKYEKYARIAYIGSIIVLALVPILGSSAKGATRWLEIGPIRFQPSEVAKIALIIFYASWLTKNKDNLKRPVKGFLKPILYFIPIGIILIVFQDHLSATIIIVLIVAIMMLMAGVRLRYFLTIGSLGVVGGAGVLWAMAKFTEKGAYRISRITTFINPWSDAQGDGWQIIQSLYAIGSGGLFGVGLRTK
jgi:cell division protein FtsW